MVAAEAAWLVGVGAAIGIPCAIGLLRLLTDPVQIGPLHQVGALGTAIALLAAASGVAAYWPVRRALRVDPAVSLRA
jgi:ABC-type antimicrobial peptide transport system permease subunit